MSRTLFRAALAALVLLVFAAPAVLGHAELETASPGPDDEVVGSPPELVAEFSQDLDASRTSLEVRDATGSRIAQGGEAGDGPREFRLDLPELTPGTYEVRWTSFSSEDGELARGSYEFTVIAAPSPTPTLPPSPTVAPTDLPTSTPFSSAETSPSPTPAPSDGSGTSNGGGSLILPLVAALLVVAGLGAWLLRRRPG